MIIIDDETGALLDAAADRFVDEYRNELLVRSIERKILVKSFIRLAMVQGINIAKGHYKEDRVEFQTLKGGD